MTLSSSSTLAEVEAAFDDNADYDAGAGDVTKARAYQQACRLLIRRYPRDASTDSTSLGRDMSIFQNELKRVDEWLNVNDSARDSGSVSYLDFREARR